jgi:ABC-type Zn uptake system ZnuABC Zn-binding protein ZnuA
VTRFYRAIAVTLTLVLALTGCGPRAAETAKVIAVTIKPLALIAQAVVGSALTIDILGDDSGAPRSDASDLASRSAVIFQTGAAIDKWANDLGPASIRRVGLSTALGSGTADGAWLSLADSVDMARLMRDTLDALFPEFKEGFDSRYATLVGECSQADGRLKQLVWKGSTRAFVAADATWKVAASDYGLRIIVQSSLKNLDLTSSEAASAITAWGAAEKTHVVVMSVASGIGTNVDRLSNGLVVCYLDPLATSAGGAFVPWLEGQLTLLGSALAK